MRLCRPRTLASWTGVEPGDKVKIEGLKRVIKVDGLKRVCFETLPNVLVFSLKRFMFDLTTNVSYKLSNRCAFPRKLNMQKYTRQYLDAGDNWTKNQCLQTTRAERKHSVSVGSAVKDLAANQNFDYALKGIVVHVGSVQRGHYYSIIKDTCNQWFKFDDKNVVQFSGSISDFFGNGNRKDHTAFMLLYERAQPRKRKQEKNSAGATNNLKGRG